MFGTEATSEIYMNQFNDRTTLVNFVRDIRYRGTDQRTNMADAFELLRTDQYLEIRGDRRDVPNIVIIVTDGRQVGNHISVYKTMSKRPESHGLI